MKKALVFRTAQPFVIDKLMDKLEKKGYKTWCIAQQSYLDDMKSKYPNTEFFVVDDGFFDYKQFNSHKVLVKRINKIPFTRVFVPSSSIDFNNFLEVRRIIYSLGFKKITYFVSYGKAVTMDLSFLELSAERLIKSKYFIDSIILIGNTVSSFYFIKNRILKQNR